MAFEALTPNGEKLLQEILAHRDNATKYWHERFDHLSGDEDVRIRSLFRELKEAGLIDTMWADNFPYHIVITDNGYTYTERKKADAKEKNKLSHREWRIAIASAIIGAVIGLIPTIVQWLMSK